MLKVSPQRKMDDHVRKLRRAKGVKERALWYPRDSARRDKLLNSQEGTRMYTMDEIAKENMLVANPASSKLESQFEAYFSKLQAEAVKQAWYRSPAGPSESKSLSPEEMKEISKAAAAGLMSSLAAERAKAAQDAQSAQRKNVGKANAEPARKLVVKSERRNGN